MKFVTSFGAVYRLTNRKYVMMLRAIADKNGHGVNLEEYGTFVGVITANITDMTAEEAEDLLAAE